MKFASPHLLELLWIIPILVLFHIIAQNRKRKAKKRLGDNSLIEKMCSTTDYKRQWLKFLFTLLSLILVIFTLARPQYGTRIEKVKHKGIDIMILLDVSKSMLAQDVKPSRLERAKIELSSFIDRLRGDRIGICPFAGKAFISCPLTLDYEAVKLFLDILNPESIPTPGTNIGAAIEKALESFGEEIKYRVCVLITDGENLKGDPIGAAEEAGREGVKIYTVGIGTPLGEPIPERDENGNITGYKKDNKGAVVMSKLDEVTLRKIALITNAKYMRVQKSAMELPKIYSSISRLEKKEIEGEYVTHYEDRFQWPLSFAILFLSISFFISDRKREI
jgi:Ca-activated chloride channel family protein